MAEEQERAVDIRDVLAITGLVALAFGAGAVIGALAGALAGSGGALFVAGLGLFYLGVWHRGR